MSRTNAELSRRVGKISVYLRGIIPRAELDRFLDTIDESENFDSLPQKYKDYIELAEKKVRNG